MREYQAQLELTYCRPQEMQKASSFYEAMLASFGKGWVKKDWRDGRLAWLSCRPPGSELPHQGWKIHVTATVREAVGFLEAVLPELASLGAAFKVPPSPEGIYHLNCGDAGMEMLGKVLTVYPLDDVHARRSILALDAAWPFSEGPEVQTDLHVRPGSAVSFRYGAYGVRHVVISSTGIHQIALEWGDALVPDGRAGTGRAPDGIRPPVEGFPPGRCPIAPGREVRVGGETYVVLGKLSEKPQRSVFIAAETSTFRSAILITARPGVGGDASGADGASRLRMEHDLLADLGATGVAPAPIGFEEAAWPIMAIEDVRGEPLSRLPASRRKAALPSLADAVQSLHELGVVHGDIKPENAILRDGRVVLVDFEHAFRTGSPLRRGGTPGYVPPGGSGGAADPSRDVYALASCLFEATMDFPPGLLPNRDEVLEDLLESEGAAMAVAIARASRSSDGAVRPSARDVGRALRRLTDRPAPIRDGVPVDRAWCADAALHAARETEAYVVAREIGSCWRNDHFMRSFECEAINIGAAGIMIGLAAVATSLRTDEFEHRIRSAASWLAANGCKGKSAGLFTGNSGVAVALAMAGKRCGEGRFLQAAERRYEAAVRDEREFDLFSGAAGTLLAGCILRAILQDDWPLDLASDVASRLCRTRGLWNGIPIWKGPESEAAFLGCAHGSSGVALALGKWHSHTGDRMAGEIALEVFRGIRRAALAQGEGWTRVATSGERRHAPGNWCHGTAGYLWSMLVSSLDISLLRDEIDWAVVTLGELPVIGTATFCHGLAGQAELWRMLASHPVYGAFAETMAGKAVTALKALRDRENGCWISDDPGIVSPDLWVGFTGPAAALAMLAAREEDALLSERFLSRCASCPNGHRQ